MEADLLTQRRFELLLEMVQQKTEKSITELSAKIQTLQEQNALLSKELSTVKSALDIKPKVEQTQPLVTPELQQVINKAAGIESNSVKAPQPQPIQPKPVQESAQTNSDTQGQTRFGDYTSNDVSVEKFFYFGGK